MTHFDTVIDDPSRPGTFVRKYTTSEYCSTCREVTDHGNTLTFDNGIQRMDVCVCRRCMTVKWDVRFKSEV